MAFERQITCDGCGTVLNGMVKGKRLLKTHYQIDGKVLLQLIDPVTKWKEHIYLTHEPTEFLSFCLTQGFPCQQSFFDNRRGAYAFKKRQRLQEQATSEHLDRLERGSS